MASQEQNGGEQATGPSGVGPGTNSDEAAMAMDVALGRGLSQVRRGSVAGEMKPCEEGRGGVGRGAAGLGCWLDPQKAQAPCHSHAGPGGRRLRVGDRGSGEAEVSCIWDETPSFVNARNVQRSIWFCFFQLPPLSTAWVLWRGP